MGDNFGVGLVQALSATTAGALEMEKLSLVYQGISHYAM
jgi:hypothetical protein